MSKGSLAFIIIIVLGIGGYYFYDTQVCCSFLSKKTIEVSGEERDVRSRKSLEELGFEQRCLPNGRNAAILYLRATNIVDQPKGQVGRYVSDVVAHKWISERAFTKWFDNNADALKLIHRAARKPDAEFPVFGKDDEPVYTILLPHLAPMRTFARLLVCEGKRYEHEKDPSRALESYFAITSLAEHIHDSTAMLVDDLVAIALQGYRNGAVEYCLANKSLSKQDLRRVIEHYEHVLESHIALTECLDREKCSSDSMVDEMMRNARKGTREYSKAMAVLSESAALPSQAQENVVQLIEAHGTEMKAAYERDYAALKRWSKLPAWQALQPGRDWKAYMDTVPTTSVFSRMLLPAMDRAKTVYARSKAEAGGILIVAAIKLYEKENGRPPRSLAELEGDYLSELPTDPFSGRDYVCKVRGDDWIVYSVWDNLTDDGGAGWWPHEHTKDRDFIWRNTRLPVKQPPK
jgi:hypothetical protein